MNKVFSVLETAVALRVCPETIYKLVGSGELRHSKVKNRIIITEKDIDTFLKKTKVGKK